MKVNITEALEQLEQAHGQLFAKVMEHGTMSVEIYRPVKKRILKRRTGRMNCMWSSAAVACF